MSIDGLKALVNKGVPVFTQDWDRLAGDIVRSQYFAVRAQLPNAEVIFPNDGQPTGIEWLVCSDDFGIGDALRHIIYTEYERGCAENNGITNIRVQSGHPYSNVSVILQADDVRARWEAIQALCPQDMHEKFDISSWYEMMTYDY
jgi:hypothetical protein